MKIDEIKILEKGPKSILRNNLTKVDENIRIQKNWQKFRLAYNVKEISQCVDDNNTKIKNFNELKILNCENNDENIIKDKDGFESLLEGVEQNRFESEKSDLLSLPMPLYNTMQIKDKFNSQTTIEPFDLLLDKFSKNIDETLFDKLPKFSIPKDNILIENNSSINKKFLKEI